MTCTDIVHWTAWGAFALWFGAEDSLLRHHHRRARHLWTAAAAVLALHIAAAFQWQHHWSHAAAVSATAEQTASVTGWSWGGGVWINYAMLTFWSVDVVRWWRSTGTGESNLPHPALRCLFAFLWFQGAVVFAHGVPRAVAGSVFVWLALRIWLGRRPPTIETGRMAQ